MNALRKGWNRLHRSPRPGQGWRFRSSLLFRYLLIIVVAMLLLPIVLPATVVFYSLLIKWESDLKPKNPHYPSSSFTINSWHREAIALKGAAPEQISARLRQIQRDTFPDSQIFWVNAAGRTRLELPAQPDVPKQWSASQAIAFMKQVSDEGPLTIVAFIGGGKDDMNQGYMVLKVPRSFFEQPNTNISMLLYNLFFIVLVLAGFIFVSLLFFVGIRRRLVRLQAAMSQRGEDGLPILVTTGRPDEIGKLEEAFNQMVEQLAESRGRERQEEELRKRLVADLSHDIRTPLTVVRSHLYTLDAENLSVRARQSITLMENKLKDLGSLIDNLLIYNLLSSGKYTLNNEPRDILRLVRECAASWYPVWEKEGFEVDIDLPEHSIVWKVDEQGFRRLLDNIFQNVVRHAASGRYIGIHIQEHHGKSSLVIADKGPGMEWQSSEKGTGIGLAITELLAREMNLKRDIVSSSAGTQIRFLNKT
ncbi:histidine kinase dimerization/phospho-acceptor domain-containing protein [Paenibacillus farraposensis]|uniref:histidine kinase n=1 Tax=Paenibacillus farraposensis TaxID=2807095 RepID=A0ABW4DAR5_9BACL|nr:HAMP domain-containing sensor histidine kinase [Paenibacillus farraposensis]MCC3378979.1 HAMP domain-containing histidine kinase [Paenibacillus farraposensis]